LADRLTLIVRRRWAIRPPLHSLICRQASRKFHQPSSRMRPVSSATGINSIGPSRPRVGMLPSQQSLKAGNFSGSESNNRLIEIAKFSALEGAMQISLQLQSGPSHWLAYPRRTPHNGPFPETWPDTLPCRHLAGYLPAVRRLSCLMQFRCSLR